MKKSDALYDDKTKVLIEYSEQLGTLSLEILGQCGAHRQFFNEFRERNAMMIQFS